MRKYLFTFFILFCALFVASISAYFSITGLAAAFTGAFIAIVLMAVSLEVSKIAIASLLYSYRKTLHFLAKTFFTITLVTLIGITSIGVYAFLSASYEQQSYQLTITQTQISELEGELGVYERDIERFNDELLRIDSRVDNLSQIGSREIEVRDTAAATGIRSTVYTAEFRAAQSRINEENERRAEVLQQRSVARDSLNSIRSQIAQARASDDSVEHLGPLIFIARVLDVPMDQVMGILILVITVFLDPLAVMLIVMANFTAEQAQLTNQKQIPTQLPIKQNTDMKIKPEVKKTSIQKSESQKTNESPPKKVVSKKKKPTASVIRNIDVKDKKTPEELKQEEEKRNIYKGLT